MKSPIEWVEVEESGVRVKCMKCGKVYLVDGIKGSEWKCECGGWLKGRWRQIKRGKCRVCGSTSRGYYFSFPFEVDVEGRRRRFKGGWCCFEHRPRSGFSYVERRDLWQEWMNKGYTPLFVGVGWCAWADDKVLRVAGKWQGRGQRKPLVRKKKYKSKLL